MEAGLFVRICSCCHCIHVARKLLAPGSCWWGSRKGLSWDGTEACLQLLWVTFWEGVQIFRRDFSWYAWEAGWKERLKKWKRRLQRSFLWSSCVARLSGCDHLREWNWEKELDSIQGLDSSWLCGITKCLSTSVLLTWSNAAKGNACAEKLCCESSWK